MTVYLDPATEQVRQLIVKSIRETPSPTPLLTIRCHRGDPLGRVVRTNLGPGFVSSWEIDGERPRTIGTVNGRPLTPREARRLDAQLFEVTAQSGPPPHGKIRDGVVALIALPAGLNDYPALLVRCGHGDTVLSRSGVLEALSRQSRTWKVSVDMPYTEYHYHDPTSSWLPSTTTRSHETRSLRSSSLHDE